MPPSGAPSVRVRGVVKRFGDVVALDRVSLEVRGGEIVGLLGPNGSGKSTLMRVVVGLLRPDEGEVSVCGHDPFEEAEVVRQLVGYVPEEAALYESLSVREFLEFVARARGLRPEAFERRGAALVRAFGLEGLLDDLIGTLSRGNRQRVAIVAALLHDPEVLVLDEPVMGLDPASARVLREYLVELRGRGRAILLSTHILGVAEALCDKVAIMSEGRVLAEGTVSELRARAAEGGTLEEVFLRVTGKDEEVERLIEALRGC